MSRSARCSVHTQTVLDCPRCLEVRQRDAWSEWIVSRQEWQLFGGLTFDQRRRVLPPPGEQRNGGRLRVGERLSENGEQRLTGARPMGREAALWRLRTFFDEGERAVGRRMAGVVGLEYHRNGWPHFHPLLAIEGGLAPSGREIATLGGLWFDLSGGNRLEVVRDRRDAGAYASKYLTKDLDQGDVFFWPERGALKGFGQRSMWERKR